MKNLIISLLAVFLCLESSAQLKDIEIIWGQPYKSKKTVVTDIISAEGGEIYAVKQRLGFFSQDIFIEKYRDLEPYQSNEIQFNDANRVETSKNIIKLGQDLWMLSFTTSYENAMLQARFIEKETLTPLGETVDVFSVDVQRKMRYSYGGFDYAISKDTRKIGFVTQYPGDRDERALMGFQVFDQFFDPMWEQDFELPYDREFVELEAMQVSQDNKVYLLIRLYEPKRINGSKRGGEYTHRLLCVNENGISFNKEISLDQDKGINNIHFELTENNELMLAGFYGTSCCTIAGSFFMTISADGEDILAPQSQDFDLDFIAEGVSERKRKRLEKQDELGEDIGFDNVDFRDFIVREDGSVVLIGELYAVTQEGRGQDAVPTHFNYKSIIVVNIQADGQIAWNKKILKRQLTVDDGGFMSGFVLAVNGDKLHFIFNDHEDNLDVRTEKELVTYSRKKNSSVVAMVTLDQDGEMTKEGLISQKELGLEIRPMSCEQVSANELILFGMNRTENQFARLLF